MAENEPFMTFVDPNEPQQQPEQPAQSEPVQQEQQTQSTVQTSAVMRTYHQDVSRVMGQNNPKIMSSVLASAHMAEAQQEAKNPISPRNKNYIIGSVAFLLLGLSVLAFAVYRNYATVQTLRESQELSLISAETHTNVTLAENELFKNRGRVTQAVTTNVPLQTINHIFFTKQTITGLARLGFTDVIQSTGGSIPQNLLQTLDSNFMYGTYQSDKPLPFLILRVQKYDDAFTGMRAWEPLMIDHLGFLFNLPDALQANFNKSTFIDRIIANHAVRAVVYHAEPVLESLTQTEGLPIDIQTESTETETMPISTTTESTETIETIPTTVTTESTGTIETLLQAMPLQEQQPEIPYQEGDTVLLYTFLDEHTVLIATSEAVMREILFRLTNAQLLI